MLPKLGSTEFGYEILTFQANLTLLNDDKDGLVTLDRVQFYSTL